MNSLYVTLNNLSWHWKCIYRNMLWFFQGNLGHLHLCNYWSCVISLCNFIICDKNSKNSRLNFLQCLKSINGKFLNIWWTATKCLFKIFLATFYQKFLQWQQENVFTVLNWNVSKKNFFFLKKDVHLKKVFQLFNSRF